MKLREKAKRFYEIINSNVRKTVREIAADTSISKSSVQRNLASQRKRVNSVGHDFFETEAGADFLKRLFYCVIFIFGIQASVGSETLSLFFNTMMLTFYVGCSASCIRDVKTKLRLITDTYGDMHTDDIIARCDGKELRHGSEEGYTFFATTSQLATELGGQIC